MKLSELVPPDTLCTFVFDVDETIATRNPAPPGDRTYSYWNVEPIPEMVAKLRQLHALGHRIVLHTARNMETFRGNLDDIHDFTEPLLRTWLKKYNIPYHELVMGKPHGAGVYRTTFYIDDRNLSLSDFNNLTVEP